MNQMSPPPINLSADQRARLQAAISSDQLAAEQKHAAQIILLTDDGLTRAEITKKIGVTAKSVRRSRRQFRLEGIELMAPEQEQLIAKKADRDLPKQTIKAQVDEQEAEQPAQDEQAATVQFAIAGFYVDAPDRAIILIEKEQEEDETLTDSAVLEEQQAVDEAQQQSVVSTLAAGMDKALALNHKRSFKLARTRNFCTYLDRAADQLGEDQAVHVIVDTGGASEQRDCKKWFSSKANWQVRYTSDAVSFGNVVEQILLILVAPAQRDCTMKSCTALSEALEKYVETNTSARAPFCYLQRQSGDVALPQTDGRAGLQQPEQKSGRGEPSEREEVQITERQITVPKIALADESLQISQGGGEPGTHDVSLLTRIEKLKQKLDDLDQPQQQPASDKELPPVIDQVAQQEHMTDEKASRLPQTSSAEVADPIPLKDIELDNSPVSVMDKEEDPSFSFKLESDETITPVPDEGSQPEPVKAKVSDRTGDEQPSGFAQDKKTDGKSAKKVKASGEDAGAGGGKGGGSNLHQRSGDDDFRNALRDAVGGFRRSVVTIGIFSVAVNVLILAIPIYLFQVSDRVLTSRSLDTLIMLSVVVVGALFVHVLLDMMRRILLMRAGIRMETLLGAPVLSAAVKSSHAGSNKDFQSLMDLEQLRNFISGPVMITFFDAPLAPVFFLAVFLIHPHLGFILCTAAGLVLVVALINQKLTAIPYAKASGFGMRASLQADAMSRNALVVNAMGMIREGVNLWGRETAESLKAHVIAQDRNIYMAGLSKFIRLTTQIAMLGWGAYLAIGGELTGGMIIAASIIGSRALAPVIGTIEGWRGFVQARNGYGRIKALLQASPLNHERLRLPRPMGKLNVDRVLFVPPTTKKVILNGISFSLDPGESLAIVGPSGTGKTTLARMLVGSISPTAGNVRLDKMDIRNWDPRQFGESVGYLPQDVELFPASIKANIARMREDVSDESIFLAAEIAGVHDMISKMPQGYETPINVDGSPLSGGQKQRIGLARAFFGAPRLVVLDEPNSNLDSPGEKALAAALARAKDHNITVVAVTQRPSLLKNVDKIMVLDEGRIQKLGHREEILLQLAGPQQAA